MRVALARVRTRRRKPRRAGVVVLVEDSEAVVGKAAPSVSKAQTRRYEALRETFGNWKDG